MHALQLSRGSIPGTYQQRSTHLNRAFTRPRALRPAAHHYHPRPAAKFQNSASPWQSRSVRRDLRVSCQNVVTEQPGSTTSAVSTAKGSPEPLGPSVQGSGINFALFSAHSKSVTLCFRDEKNTEVTEVPMTRTGDVWHVLVEGMAKSGVLYGVKVAGEGGWETGHRWFPNTILLDPYAPLVWGRQNFGKRDERENFRPKVGSQFWGTFDFESEPFDWGKGYERPNLHLKDLTIYEMSVRCFTADESSGLPAERRGTYLGVADKVEHLKTLGVNAVELLPVFEYDELEFQRRQNPRDHMVNVWGYSHLSFMAPMSRFGTADGGPAQAAREFKEMVRTLHGAGIEVLLDVVYNHTVEGDDSDPYVISFRGIDNCVYYQLDPSKYEQLLNYSGCGNTVNANHPVVQQLIIDSLVHWVTEYHVDGFRFDLASCLCRDGRGNPLPAPPLIRAISKHPILSKVKLIAEPWDIGMYQVGSFPNWDVWAEWNGKYRDDVRRFIKGDPGMKGAFATRLAGSADLYNSNQRKPYHSINFITAHDGFSLLDLNSYNVKHNDANGEGNRDGTNDNFGWNCGAEGETGDPGINALRQRQMRNMLLALLISHGTPMFVMGDEMAKTHWGNNNWYGHDTKLAHLQWDLGDPSKMALLRFTSELVHFRRTHPALRRAEFVQPGDVTWHERDWSNLESRFLAFTLHSPNGDDLYAAFNSHHFQVDVPLPPPPPGRKWCRVVDTNLAPPKDFTPGGNDGVEASYGVAPWSSILLLAKPK